MGIIAACWAILTMGTLHQIVSKTAYANSRTIIFSPSLALSTFFTPRLSSASSTITSRSVGCRPDNVYVNMINKADAAAVRTKQSAISMRSYSETLKRNRCGHDLIRAPQRRSFWRRALPLAQNYSLEHGMPAVMFPGRFFSPHHALLALKCTHARWHEIQIINRRTDFRTKCRDM